MFDWIVSFRMIDQTVTVHNCATKNEALRMAVRLAKRINSEIRRSDIISCRPTSEASTPARATVWDAPELTPRPQISFVASACAAELGAPAHQLKPLGAKLDRQPGGLSSHLHTQTYWSDQSAIRQPAEPVISATQYQQETSFHFAVAAARTNP